jgi:hypothetical protein
MSCFERDNVQLYSQFFPTQGMLMLELAGALEHIALLEAELAESRAQQVDAEKTLRRVLSDGDGSSTLPPCMHRLLL